MKSAHIYKIIVFISYQLEISYSQIQEKEIINQIVWFLVFPTNSSQLLKFSLIRR
ncbi:hypothetical protein pb186bvf_005182 [Paramecium bursaria]